MNFSLPLFIVILVGVLATAAPGVLERVLERRLMNGWGLTEPARADDVLLAVEDCRWLGRRAVVIVGDEAHPAYIVDCQSAHHRAAFPMSGRGLVADVNDERLNHERARVMVLR